jgi:predicted MPP superfamily phosphohydrolase
MSPDSGWLIVALVLLGHGALWMVITNAAHALGLSHRGVNVARLVLLTAIVGLAWLIVRSAVLGAPADWHWMVQVYASACLAILVIGLPTVTLLRRLRRMPKGISGSIAEIDLAAEHGAEALIGSGRHAWLLRLPGNESFRLQTTEWEIDVANLPVEWDGLSLVHLSDLHFAPCFRREFFEAVADAAAAWDADIVAMTGDVVDDDQVIDWIEPILSRLSGRLGAFAILGNHDRAHHPRRIRRAVARAGFTDLEGRWTRLELEGGTLAIGGTSYPWGPDIDPSAMPEADFRLLLSHSPDQFPRAARWGVDLVLSGHNHAGQIRLPLLGPIFMPSLYSRHFDRGFFRSGRSLLHVSQGVAGQHPIRYGGCFPEVTRLVLRPAGPSARAADRAAARAREALDTLGS